ncbi:hypothetical protein EUX98_g4868 [Antrodiella citrinella]|uniref:Uncharacterized protein n=1 Tax=Antrodiella citrinella TaxID=2447956 RepID=A0A4S4MUS4_9APHY|nr:hypothetical protein EUX98_g4868 [Antrodiella citrinella]
MGEPPSRSMQNLTYVLLDMETLSPRALKEELDCEIAVGILAGHLRNPIIDRERLVGDLMVPNNLFPFVLSLLDDTTTTILIQWFEDSFPRSIESYTDSVASQLLAQLSMLFLRLQNQMTDLQDKHRRVQAAVSCLNIVSSLSFPIQATALSGNNTGPGRKQKSQRERKVQRAQYSRRASSAPDSRPFDELNLDVPTSADEAADLVAWILQEQSRILQSYLQAIRRPELAVLMREVFFVTSSRGEQGGTPDDHVSSSATTNSTAEIISPVPSEGSVYPQVQPLQAALHFDTVDGFGDWNIHITGRAESDLRFFRRRDPKLFDIVLKKIKELSHGQFSRDNHKQLDLAGSDIQIPIYEAKMTGDSRLVYQVDCVTEYIKQEIGNMRHNGQCEQQVLRVFGIYTHKQMKRRFWKAVSHNLGGKGSEYRDRTNKDIPLSQAVLTGKHVMRVR